jgi:hypothetical protein
MSDSIRQRLNRTQELTRQMHALHQQFTHPDTPDGEKRRLHRQMRALYLESITASEYAFLGILETLAPPPAALTNRPPGVLPVIWGRAINYPRLLIVMGLFSLSAAYSLLA